MVRSQLCLRRAEPGDAEELALLWGEVLRRADHEEQVADVRTVIERVSTLEDERMVVAEYDGRLAGAVHLLVGTLSPLNLEPVVQTVSPHVFPEFRRRGVGCALMEAAVAFAEEHEIGHVATAAVAGARDANRFMARLALGPLALVRVAPTHAVKARLGSRYPGAVGTGGRQRTRVLAARRSMRRSQSSPSTG